MKVTGLGYMSKSRLDTALRFAIDETVNCYQAELYEFIICRNKQTMQGKVCEASHNQTAGKSLHVTSKMCGCVGGWA